MLLSTYQRLRRYCTAQGSSSPLTDNTQNKRELLTWLSVVSSQIEKYINRKLSIEERTEYFDIRYMMDKFYPTSTPIKSISSVHLDSTGLWDGSESEETDYFIGSDENSIIIDNPVEYEAEKAIKIVYTGGLSYSAARAVYAIGSIAPAGDETGQYVCGNSSSAIGIVSALSATSIAIDVLYGTFEIGETITVWSNEDCNDTEGVTATISSLTTDCLSISAPEIVAAAEMQIRYNWKHKHDFEVTGIDERGQSNRAQANSRMLSLQPEVVAMLDPYKVNFIW